MDQDTNKSEIDMEWENRRLCPDGNCIGIIGPEGKCMKCGLTAESDERSSAHLAKNGSPSINQEITDNFFEPDKHDSDFGIDADWDRRILCGDESCIGTIGPNGKCSECRKMFTSSALK